MIFSGFIYLAVSRVQVFQAAEKCLPWCLRKWGFVFGPSQKELHTGAMGEQKNGMSHCSLHVSGTQVLVELVSAELCCFLLSFFQPLDLDVTMWLCKEVFWGGRGLCKKSPILQNTGQGGICSRSSTRRSILLFHDSLVDMFSKKPVISKEEIYCLGE